MSRRRPRLRLAACAALLLGAGACDDMTDQPRRSAYDAPPPGQPAHTVEFRASAPPVPPVTLALLERGRERYGIFCAPCHAELGDGRGMIVQRGFPAPPSFHSARLRALEPRKIYHAITAGYGLMYAFGDRIAPQDRWAIAAYVRALQRSQHARETPP